MVGKRGLVTWEAHSDGEYVEVAVHYPGGKYTVKNHLSLVVWFLAVLMAPGNALAWELAGPVMAGMGRELKGYLREDAWVDLGKTR